MTTASAEKPNVPQDFLTTTIEFAQLCAEGANFLLRKWGATPDQVQSRPPALMLELGALFYIDWLNHRADSLGLHLPQLPNFQHEEEELLDRIQNSPTSFATLEGALLSRRMFRFQMNNVAWGQPEDVAGGLPQLYVMPDADPFEFDSMLDRLAEIIYDRTIMAANNK